MNHVKFIDITSQDIAVGQRRKACHDAVSRACIRAFGTTVSVGYTKIVVHGGPMIDVPSDLRNWLICFDNGIEVKPGRFRLSW